MGNHHRNRGELKMAGTKAGGLKAAQTNKQQFGEDFYKNIGSKGGKNGKGPGYKGGFAADNERAKIAGAKGGSISRRTSKYHKIFEENRNAIEATLKSTATLKDLAESMGVPYLSLLNYVKKYVYDK